MQSRRRFLSFALATLATLAGAQTTSAPSGTLEGPALVAALRQGGYVLYMRHTSTDFGQNDEGMTDYANCAAEARAIGAALRDLRIPVGPVLASPYCRTLETGRLVFGNPTVSMAVVGGPGSDNGNRYAELRKLLSTPVPKGSNLAIASHGNPFRAVAGSPYLAEGEIAVIQTEADGRFRVVARITKTDWAALR